MEYTLRRSKRARYLRIRVSARHGVELVVPPGVSESRATAFLHQRLDWVRQMRARLEPASGVELPRRIELAALGRSVAVERGGSRLRFDHDRLLLPAEVAPESAAQALRDWLRRQARDFLPGYCRRQSALTGLDFDSLRVGLQSSRWGSFSTRGTLSLNAKLMLMPEPVLRYVVHHELTHGLHMDHSPAFWSALARHQPDWQSRRRELRQLGAALPAWVQGGRRARGQARRLLTAPAV